MKEQGALLVMHQRQLARRHPQVRRHGLADIQRHRIGCSHEAQRFVGTFARARAHLSDSGHARQPRSHQSHPIKNVSPLLRIRPVWAMVRPL